MIFTGKTIEQAFKDACAKMGLDPDETVYQVVSMPKKGFLGIGAQSAEISIEVELPDEVREEKPQPKKEIKEVAEKKNTAKEQPQKPKKETKPLTDEKKAQIEGILDYLKAVIKGMGVEKFDVSYEIEGDNLRIELTGEDIGVIIGRRGETLDALQYLTGLCANRGGENFFRVSLNSGDFRKNREETLKSLAKKKAAYVLKTHRSASLEPMNPYERRIIHSTISEIEGVHSKSVGTDPNRKVVIFPNTRNDEGDARPDRRNSRGRGDRRPRGGYDRKPAQTAESAPRETEPKSDAENISLYTKIEL